MTVAISFGWWLLPLAITIVAFARAIWVSTGDRVGGDYAMIGQALSVFVALTLAVIISLIAWLIYFVVV